MKNLKFLLSVSIILSIFLSTTSCKKEQVLETHESEILKENLNDQNHEKSTCSFNDQYNSNTLTVDQRHVTNYNYQWIGTCPITVCIEQCLPEDNPKWNPAVMEAIKKFNAIPFCRIKFELTTDCENANLTIECLINEICGTSRNNLFTADDPSEQIEMVFRGTLDCDCTEGSQEPLSDCQRLYIVMHNLGHLLGLGHTDDSDNGNSPNYLQGTPILDPLSIMNGSDLSSFCECTGNFSPGDIDILQRIYKQTTVDITTSGNLIAGQTIQVTSYSSGGEYTVWAIFEGIPTRFFVHSQPPGSTNSLTTDYTLQNDPSMGCKMTLYAEDCQGEIVTSQDYSLGSLSQIYPSIADQADPSYPPQLGEDILVKTIGNGKSDYRVRLKYTLSGQTQYQIVADVKCDSQDETWITLWSNPGLAYKTIVIEALKDGNIIGSLPFTIFP